MDRIIAILEKIDRPGMKQVIEYMRKSNYARAFGGSHHKYRGGLVDHALEVYQLMMERRGDLPEDSVAICAFFHDLGKSRCAGYQFEKDQDHPIRSVVILDRCGFQLTNDERLTIEQHHSNWRGYFAHPLRHCLSSSDMTSTGNWKMEHTKAGESPFHRLKNALLLEFSKKKLR